MVKKADHTLVDYLEQNEITRPILSDGLKIKVSYIMTGSVIIYNVYWGSSIFGTCDRGLFVCASPKLS